MSSSNRGITFLRDPASDEFQARIPRDALMAVRRIPRFAEFNANGGISLDFLRDEGWTGETITLHPEGLATILMQAAFICAAVESERRPPCPDSTST